MDSKTKLSGVLESIAGADEVPRGGSFTPLFPGAGARESWRSVESP